MWKQRKLSELMTFSNGINAPKENYGKGRKMISVMDILQEAPIKYENIRNSVKVDEKIEAKNKVENGDLVFVRSSEVREEVGWAKAYLEEKYALYSGFSIRGKKQNEFNSHFIELTLNSVNRKQLERKAGGSTRFNVSQNILNNVKIFSPTIEEQNKIDKLFKIFNDAITLHQEKLAKLQSLKKAALQNLFPQKDETEPKVRFAYFSSSWQQRKLNELTIYQNGKGHEKKQFNQGDFELVNLNSISIDGGLKPSGKFINEAEDTLNKNDLVMVLSDVGHGDLLGRVALIPENNRFVLNQRVALLRPNKSVSPEFLFFYINTHQRYFKSQGAGMSQLNISKSSVENFANYIPVYEEQIKIGQTLKKLDDLITLHQQKLEKLQNLKKAFLQKMFI